MESEGEGYGDCAFCSIMGRVGKGIILFVIYVWVYFVANGVR